MKIGSTGSVGGGRFGFAAPARIGTKRSRKCPRCNANPNTRCWVIPKGTWADGTVKHPTRRSATYHSER